MFSTLFGKYTQNAYIKTYCVLFLTIQFDYNAPTSYDYKICLPVHEDVFYASSSSSAKNVFNVSSTIAHSSSSSIGNNSPPSSPSAFGLNEDA